MCPNRAPSSGSTVETDSEPRESVTRDEVEWLSEAEASDERVSIVDPLFYAPLLLGGTALIVFPEPATTAIGIFCLVAGIVLAAVDLLSVVDSD